MAGVLFASASRSFLFPSRRRDGSTRGARGAIALLIATAAGSWHGQGLAGRSKYSRGTLLTNGELRAVRPAWGSILDVVAPAKHKRKPSVFIFEQQPAAFTNGVTCLL